jgi:hypothetical protein
MSRVGAGTLVTPREIIRDLLTVLDILYQNPEADFNNIIKREEKNFNQNPAQDKDDEIPEVSSEDSADGGEKEPAQKAFEMKFEDLEV